MKTLLSSAGFAAWLLVAGSITAGQEAPAPQPRAARRADYKAVFWYRRDRPIETFQYQVYDVREGEYTKAVDDWTEMMRQKYPRYEVAVREVDLDREKGPNEKRKVGAVVHRELLAVAAAAGVFVGPLGSPLSGVPSQDRSPVLGELGPKRLAPRYSPLGPMLYQNPSPAGFPVPMPYPRPHP